MKNFIYYTPTWIQFGPDSLKETAKLVRRFHGGRVLLVCGQHAVKDGLLEAIRNQLEKDGLFTAAFAGIRPNPEYDQVLEAIDTAQKAQCDFILAVGGGSVIDAAKAIGYGLKYPGQDLWNLWDRKATAKASVPVGCILTIAAAGSEMSDSAVLTRDGVKRGYSSQLGRPKFAILDPELTLSLPWYPTMCGCADIFMHTLERYLSGGSHMEITDQISEALMRTVLEQTDILKQDLKNRRARAELMWCGSLSHNGLTECGTVKDFSCHALGHELSGLYGVAHGASLTAVWLAWAQWSLDENRSRFTQLARQVFHKETAEEGIQALTDWFASLGLPTSLAELGLDLDETALRRLAEACERHCGGCKGTAKVMTGESFYTVYKKAMELK